MQEIGPIQEKWLQALESGQFAQGKGFLCSDGKFCCLGVACEVLGLEKHKAGPYMHYGPTCADSAALIPESGMELLGLYGRAGAIKGSILVNGDTYSSLATLNDKSNLIFPEIAALIRANPEKFFKETK